MFFSFPPHVAVVDWFLIGHLGRRAVDVEKEIQDEAAVQHHLLDRLDLRIVTAPVQERAIVLVIEGIADNVENLFSRLMSSHLSWTSFIER